MPEPTREQLDKIDVMFTYHTPTPEQVAGMGEIRRAAKELALTIARHAPVSADQTVAIRHVSDAVMNANAAIVREGK